MDKINSLHFQQDYWCLHHVKFPNRRWIGKDAQIDIYDSVRFFLDVPQMHSISAKILNLDHLRERIRHEVTKILNSVRAVLDHCLLRCVRRFEEGGRRWGFGGKGSAGCPSAISTVEVFIPLCFYKKCYY